MNLTLPDPVSPVVLKRLQLNLAGATEVRQPVRNLQRALAQVSSPMIDRHVVLEIVFDDRLQNAFTRWSPIVQAS
jgi:hypothetical protein